MTSANQQQLCLQCVDVVDHRPSSLVIGQESTICDIVWMSLQTHPFHCLSDPISFDMCCSDPVLSRNGSVMTNGVGENGNREANDLVWLRSWVGATYNFTVEGDSDRKV